MIQRMKVDIVLFIAGVTFLSYSIFGDTNLISEDNFRFILGIVFMIGALYLILSPEGKWR
jgi:hypothetical protein